jgi:L-2-hydroxyglutarate oxidase LhgO
MAGIRPKTQKPGGPIRDFYIKEESERGNPGFINLIGMESPGMTSCLAIANFVRGMVKKE